MDKQQAKNRISVIKKELIYASVAYFTHNEERIPETVRDSLKRELIALENEYPEFITKDSPSQVIGARLDERFKKVSHAKKKESLFDVFSFEEIIEWKDRLRKLVDEDYEYYLELKLDGLNITVRYEDGNLIHALTRGDGMQGENVTHTAETIASIPQKLPENLSAEITGEVFFLKEDYESLNKEMNLERPF